MDDLSIQQIVAEIAPLLIGRALGKIFQFGANALAIDFGIHSHGYLFISIDPSLPRLYLVKRRVRDLERQSTPLNQFGLSLKRELAGTTTQSVAKDIGDRVVRFHFGGEDELGQKTIALVAQLTGRSANLFLMDAGQTIIHAARFTDNPGQKAGTIYAPPTGAAKPQTKTPLFIQIQSGEFESASEAADAYFSALLSRRKREAQITAARSQVRKNIAQQQKLLKQLESDLQEHADAANHKRIGDLLLANISSARRRGRKLTLIDYFSAEAALVNIELDESTTLPEEAQRRFAMYQRSKRANAQISSRIVAVKKQLQEFLKEQRELEERFAKIESIPTKDELARSKARKVDLVTDKPSSSRTSEVNRVPGTRRYLSSDGFEMFVGRTSKDNDYLTTKVAKPNDVWLHAADYGGSHVVIRNATRKDVPHRTLVEAAQIAAYFSQAKKDPKVDVNYTARKFVTKPKGSKPGLVRLQRFKTITVAPCEAGVRR